MNFKILVKNLLWDFTAFKTIDNLPDCIVAVNADGEVIHFNKKAQAFFGIEYQNVELIKFDDIVKNGMDSIKTSVETSRPILTTIQHHTKGSYVELNASRRGKGYCVSIRDLTKLTDEIVNDDKIARFNGEKNAMLAKLDGDLKSPITSISGFSQGLLDGLGGVLTEKQAKYIKIINSNSEELYNFVDKLIEFSKVESSIYEPDLRNFDIIELYKSIIKDFEPEITAKKLGLEFEYETLDKRNIFTDYYAIKEIFKNILDVAISMTETGYVYVKVTHPDEEICQRYNIDITKKVPTSYVQLQVRDTGVGVAEEEMKYLCEPYAQLNKSKKNFLRALKLGIASILTKRADGVFDITSAVMEGTSYTIILPIEKGTDE